MADSAQQLIREARAYVRTARGRPSRIPLIERLADALEALSSEHDRLRFGLHNLYLNVEPMLRRDSPGFYSSPSWKAVEERTLALIAGSSGASGQADAPELDRLRAIARAANFYVDTVQHGLRTDCSAFDLWHALGRGAEYGKPDALAGGGGAAGQADSR